jgi:glycosyltransferase involved in cell wall biosynthesis
VDSAEREKMRDKLEVLQLGSAGGLYGAERWILALVKHFDHSSIHPIVSAIEDKDGVNPPLCIEAKRLGVPSVSFRAFGKTSPLAVKQLRAFIRDNRVQVLHTHGYKTDIMGLLAVQGTGCRIVSTPHGWTKKPDLKLRLYEIVDRIVFPFFDAVVPLSEDLYENLKSIPGLKRRLCLIRNGVDIDEVSSVAESDREVENWRAAGDFVIGFVGRLTEGKAVDVLLRAIARLPSHRLRLAIVGEGECRNKLETLSDQLGIGHRVAFFGFRQDRIRLMRGFDIFALPSRSEGIPRSVMEAMAAETPVLVSNCEGCLALVTDSVTGSVFKVDDVEHLAHKIELLKENTELRQRLARNARQVIKNRFSASRMSREYENLYRVLFWRPCSVGVENFIDGGLQRTKSHREMRLTTYGEPKTGSY